MSGELTGCNGPLDVAMGKECKPVPQLGDDVKVGGDVSEEKGKTDSLKTTSLEIKISLEMRS